MKKALIYWFSFLILLAAITVVPVACGKKPLPPETITTETNHKSNLFTSHETERNQAILDSFRLMIGKIKTTRPDCDSVCQQAVDQLLRQLNSVKASGDNGYKLKYDELKKQLDIVLKIAATQNTKEKVVDHKEDSKERIVVKPVRVEFIPDFWRYSAYFGWLCAAILALWITFKVGKSWLPVKSLP